jgi:hypothetical protein
LHGFIESIQGKSGSKIESIFWHEQFSNFETGYQNRKCSGYFQFNHFVQGINWRINMRDKEII